MTKSRMYRVSKNQNYHHSQRHVRSYVALACDATPKTTKMQIQSAVLGSLAFLSLLLCHFTLLFHFDRSLGRIIDFLFSRLQSKSLQLLRQIIIL
jgi:hypothetical protein